MMPRSMSGGAGMAGFDAVELQIGSSGEAWWSIPFKLRYISAPLTRCAYAHRGFGWVPHITPVGSNLQRMTSNPGGEEEGNWGIALVRAVAPSTNPTSSCAPPDL
jgi:hypothetical protein